jgi:hypothetical protein
MPSSILAKTGLTLFATLQALLTARRAETQQTGNNVRKPCGNNRLVVLFP